MSTSVVILLTAFALSFGGFLLKRREKNRVWTIGRKHALDEELFEFEFRTSFETSESASAFQALLSNPTVSTRVELSPNGNRWIVLGTATALARGPWYRAVLNEWSHAMQTVGSREMVIATAGKPGVGTGFVLSTDLGNVA